MSFEPVEIRKYTITDGLTDRFRQAAGRALELQYTVTDSLGSVKDATLNEYNVAQALKTLALDFIFRYRFFDGAGAGRVEVDFLVLTVPLYVALQVNGEFWHMGERREDDLEKNARIVQYVPQVERVEEVWGDQTDTEANALAIVRFKIGV
jgi:hypothetical protein